MGQCQPSTPDQRAHWTAMMLAQRGTYGVVTRLSQETGVSRPTLYAWRAQAEQALVQTFTPPAPCPQITPAPERQVLTVWMAHSSDRDIQTCFGAMTQHGLSLSTITTILAAAEQRARQWVAPHMPPTVRAIAVDAIDANDRRGAYLSIADVQSGARWACVGPLAVDEASWTLVRWEARDHGLVDDRVVMDGGAAVRAGCRIVTPTCPSRAINGMGCIAVRTFKTAWTGGCAICASARPLWRGRPRAWRRGKRPRAAIRRRMCPPMPRRWRRPRALRTVCGS